MYIWTSFVLDFLCSSLSKIGKLLRAVNYGAELNNIISEKILTAVFTVHREQRGSLFNIYFSFDGRYIILFGLSSKLIFNNLPHDRSTHQCLSVATKRVSRQSACSSLPFLIPKRSPGLASTSFRVPSQETGSFRSSRVFFGPQSCEGPLE